MANEKWNIDIAVILTMDLLLICRRITRLPDARDCKKFVSLSTIMVYCFFAWMFCLLLFWTGEGTERDCRPRVHTFPVPQGIRYVPDLAVSWSWRSGVLYSWPWSYVGPLAPSPSTNYQFYPVERGKSTRDMKFCQVCPITVTTHPSNKMISATIH